MPDKKNLKNNKSANKMQTQNLVPHFRFIQFPKSMKYGC